MSKRSVFDTDYDDLLRGSPKRARVESSKAAIRGNLIKHFKPERRYKNHPDSGVGKDFHSVPYPLSLLPKKSWEALNQGETEGSICSKCGKAKQSSVHERKLFLVAERLSWELNAVSSADRSQNEVNLWSVNAELDIFEPAVDDENVVLGGRRSRTDQWYPYRNETEAMMAMRIVKEAEALSARSWPMWKGMVDIALQQQEQENTNESEGVLDLTGDTAMSSASQSYLRRPLSEVSPNQTSSLPTPPGSVTTNASKPLIAKTKGCSFPKMADFYSLMDKIERTSPMGAKYLAAYAERLHVGACQNCWFDRNVIRDLMADEPESEQEVEEEEEDAASDGMRSRSSKKTHAPVPQPAPRISTHQLLGLPTTQLQPSQSTIRSNRPNATSEHDQQPGILPSNHSQQQPRQPQVIVAPLPAQQQLAKSARAPVTATGQSSQSNHAVVNMLAIRARSDPQLRDLMDVVATRHCSQAQVLAFQQHVDDATRAVYWQNREEERQKREQRLAPHRYPNAVDQVRSQPYVPSYETSSAPPRAFNVFSHPFRGPQNQQQSQQQPGIAPARPQLQADEIARRCNELAAVVTQHCSNVVANMPVPPTQHRYGHPGRPATYPLPQPSQTGSSRTTKTLPQAPSGPSVPQHKDPQQKAVQSLASAAAAHQKPPAGSYSGPVKKYQQEQAPKRDTSGNINAKARMEQEYKNVFRKSQDGRTQGLKNELQHKTRELTDAILQRRKERGAGRAESSTLQQSEKQFIMPASISPAHTPPPDSLSDAPSAATAPPPPSTGPPPASNQTQDKEEEPQSPKPAPSLKERAASQPRVGGRFAKKTPKPPATTAASSRSRRNR